MPNNTGKMLLSYVKANTLQANFIPKCTAKGLHTKPYSPDPAPSAYDLFHSILPLINVLEWHYREKCLTIKAKCYLAMYEQWSFQNELRRVYTHPPDKPESVPSDYVFQPMASSQVVGKAQERKLPDNNGQTSLGNKQKLNNSFLCNVCIFWKYVGQFWWAQRYFS